MSSKHKRPLLLFSGGLDSTFRLLELVNEDIKRIDLLYVNGGQDHVKIKAEKKAVESIIEWLNIRNNGEVYLQQFDLESFHGGRIVRSSWTQPLSWMTAAIAFADSDKHSKVEIAYVMGDEITSQIENIKTAWEAIWRFTKFGPLVPLEFPLLFTSKAEILTKIDRELYSLTWVCERPKVLDNGTIGSCIKGNYCRACETREIEEYRYKLRTGYEYAVTKTSEASNSVETALNPEDPGYINYLDFPDLDLDCGEIQKESKNTTSSTDSSGDL